MTIKQAGKHFAKALEAAKTAGEGTTRCDCCGGYLPPPSAYEDARSWDVDSGDCDGSVQTNGNCRAFKKIGW